MQETVGQNVGAFVVSSSNRGGVDAAISSMRGGGGGDGMPRKREGQAGTRLCGREWCWEEGGIPLVVMVMMVGDGGG